MLWMAEKGIRGGICHATYQYKRGKNKCMQNYDKNKEPSYLKYWGVYDLYGWVLSQKVPANDFKWVEERSQFNDQNLEKL